MSRSRIPARFFSRRERDDLVAAIRRAEAKTSGEVRIRLERRSGGDVQRAARRAFERMGMHRTAARNGVLLFLAVADREFAVIGDVGIDATVEPAFWETVRDRLATAFAGDRFGDGLVEAIGAIGGRLASAFPRAADGDRNELPDDLSVERGSGDLP